MSAEEIYICRRRAFVPGTEVVFRINPRNADVTSASPADAIATAAAAAAGAVAAVAVSVQKGRREKQGESAAL